MLRPADSYALDPGETRFLPAHAFHLARDLRTAIERELAPHDITSQQAALILAARRHRGIQPGRLAGPLGTDTAGMTRLIDRLEAKGLLVRRFSSHDRRMIAIQITDAGRALAPELEAAFARVQARLVVGIDERELGNLQALIRRLRENLAAAAEARTEVTC